MSHDKPHNHNTPCQIPNQSQQYCFLWINLSTQKWQKSIMGTNSAYNGAELPGLSVLSLHRTYRAPTRIDILRAAQRGKKVSYPETGASGDCSLLWSGTLAIYLSSLVLNKRRQSSSPPSSSPTCMAVCQLIDRWRCCDFRKKDIERSRLLSDCIARHNNCCPYRMWDLWVYAWVVLYHKGAWRWQL